jgi:hypothetical protein
MATTRTTIAIDGDLMAAAMARAGVQSKSAAVEAALVSYICSTRAKPAKPRGKSDRPDYTGILALRGSGVISDDYDPDEAFKAHAPVVKTRTRRKK